MNEFLTVFIIVLLFAGFFLLISLLKRGEKFIKLVGDIEHELGMFFTDVGGIYRGSLDGFNLFLSRKKKKGRWKSQSIMVRLEHHHNMESSFQVSMESMFSQAKEAFGKGDYKIGDNKFDDKMLIAARNPYFITALLNKELREKILSLTSVTGELVLSENSFYITKNLYEITHVQLFISYIRTMVIILKDITGKPSIKKRLINNIRLEQDWNVRFKNIQMLVSHFPMDWEIEETLSESLDDESLEIRFESAKHLKTEGMKHLLSMLDSLGSKNHPLQTDIIKVLAENNYTQSIPLLKVLFTQSGNYSVQKEILAAFKTFEDETLNEFLREQLKIIDFETRILVIEALGTCGNLDAIEPLYSIAQSSSDSQVREAVKKAIGLIQSRLGQGDKGWLSMTELWETDGALSISDKADKGALSIKKKQNTGR
ncbi:MAG: HEAT repeat domain-containing protein [bacterium]|nr:HEAT repeat domain-containing protein [bacterium]